VLEPVLLAGQAVRGHEELRVQQVLELASEAALVAGDGGEHVAVERRADDAGGLENLPHAQRQAVQAAMMTSWMVPG